MASRQGLALLLGMTATASAGPPDAPTDISWLPVESAWISVRLRDGASPPEVARILEHGHHVGDPTRIWRVPRRHLAALRASGAVEQAWGHPDPVPPPDDPADLPPTTPDLSPEQAWRPTFGVTAAGWWPGGTGAGVGIFDVEYDLLADHEDLQNNPVAIGGGQPLGEYLYHGTAVVGILGAADDGFGTTGGAPESSLVVVHPLDGEVYDVAAAVLIALEQSRPGDVLLVSQQIDTALGLAPVSADPATWEAIALATAAGVIVVEPAGNGAVDLDDPSWGGWWDDDHDSGSIIVGSVSPSDGRWDGRSGHGSRVDLHAHGRMIVAPTTGWFRPDRFWPGGDHRQAYTTNFGGTSGASAQVASLVAAAQGVAVAVHGAPVAPSDLRSWLIASGHPQAADDAAETPVGVRPDLRRLLRTWLTP